MIFSDKALSQKLERTEARANAGFVESRARLYPESSAEWIEVAGAYAMFDGVDSPCTQTFGLGLFGEVGDSEMERIEEFFASHGAPIFHEVSPLGDPSLIALLNRRGYEPLEYSTVLYQQLNGNVPDMPRHISTRIASGDEVDVWAKTAAAGWASEAEGLAEFMLNFGRISANASGASPFLAELDGKPVASGMVNIYGEVAIMAGASTIPEARNLGAQNALLSARLKYASERGCTLAMMVTAPGSQSQKNSRKNGFEIAYTRTKWQLKK
jgi:GNAT superfamily N-acetyltransferase